MNRTHLRWKNRFLRGAEGCVCKCGCVCVCCYCSNILDCVMLRHFVLDSHICHFAFHLFFLFCSQFDAVHTPTSSRLPLFSSLCVPRRCLLQSRRSDGSTNVRNGRFFKRRLTRSLSCWKTTCHMFSFCLKTLVLSAASLPYLPHTLLPPLGFPIVFPAKLVKIQCVKATAPPADR